MADSLPLDDSCLRQFVRELLIGRLVLHVLEFGLQASDLGLAFQEEDASALVGAGGLADPNVRLCGERRRRKLLELLVPGL